ncbi:MAG TPA: hypothetical protein VFR85_15045 [Anaeromyxobacteraceae bacterium]|nr:hypothetical protein [Anaeromyxobacteraceae bacterium]
MAMPCRPPRGLLAGLLLAALGTACKKDQPAPVCELPPPQPSALATLPDVASPGQSQAIHLGVKVTGEAVTFDVPAGTASVTIVEQATSSAVPLTIRAGSLYYDNTAVPLYVDVAGPWSGRVYADVPMPPDSAFRFEPPPDGLTVLDPASDPSLFVYFFSSGPWTGALTMPNTSLPIPGTAPGDGVPAGTWTVTVGDWAHECRAFPGLGCMATTPTPSTYDLTVILKPATAPGNALRVVFYLVTVRGLTAAGAAADPDLQRLQWAMTQILAQAGIAPSFEYRDVPTEVRARFATGVDASGAGVCGTLGQLVQLAAPGNQLNVFLVDLIKNTATGGFSVVGLDPIVPGPASFGGTPASGVVVSLVDLGQIRGAGCPAGQLAIGTCGDDAVAAVVAHEAGHFLGLYHDTEDIGTIVDPIADTETCFCPACKAPTPQQCQGLGAGDPPIASPYRMQVFDCLGDTQGCGGGDNLMFWLLDVDSKGLLTPGQAAVMRSSPLVE